jgi:hypothetical protein
VYSVTCAYKRGETISKKEEEEEEFNEIAADKDMS